jgi:NADH-quinone oxidoreductase subunit G
MAYFPRGESRPHWALAAELGKELGLGHRFASGREVFAALGPKLGGALGEFRWDGLPSVGKRFGIVPLAAGTVDGRLAGNRDRVPAETTEDYRRGMARTS